jgi:hypothetical protein
MEKDASCFYFFAFIGAAVYFIGKEKTFWRKVLGFLKAIVWPAFMVYWFFKALNK